MYVRVYVFMYVCMYVCTFLIVCLSVRSVRPSVSVLHAGM